MNLLENAGGFRDYPDLEGQLVHSPASGNEKMSNEHCAW